MGISGGVDSSMATLLLKKEGYSITCVFIDLFNDKKLVERAREVAGKMNLPFKVIDKREEFKRKVIDYFTESYNKGVTPNPCTVCNREIKFATLFEVLKEERGDMISTGHYLREKDGFLYEGKDRKKDQSYFLWMIKKEIIPYLHFPLGEMKKEEVKKIMKKEGFSFPDSLESKEACFLKDGLEEFLKEKIKLTPGKIVNKEGDVLGCHEGSEKYTKGQRKGLNLSGGPYYVLSKEGSTVKVTGNKEDLKEREVCFFKPNFLVEKPPVEMEAKIRYNSPAKKGRVVKEGLFRFSEPRESITPGQSIVFYKKDKLLGGGIIKNEN